MLVELYNNKMIKIFGFLFICFILSAILSNRGFYADGGYFFLRVIDSNYNKLWPFFNDIQHIRLFIDLVNQIFVSTAVYFKIGNFNNMAFLYNFNLFIIPIIFLYLNYYISKTIEQQSVFIFSFASFIFFVLPSSIFMVNQAITFSIIIWGIFLYTFAEKTITKKDFLILNILLIFTFRGHEMILTVYPIIAISLFWKFNQLRKQFKFLRIYIFIVISLSFMYGLNWQNSHPVTQQNSDFIQTLFVLIKPNILLDSILSIPLLGVVIICIIFILYNIKVNKDKFIKTLIIIYSIYCSYIILKNLFFIESYPSLEFQYRVFIAFGTPMAMLLVIIWKKANFIKDDKNFINYLLMITFVSGIFQCIWQINHSFNWYNKMQVLKNNIYNSSDVLLNKNNIVYDNNKSSKNYNWDWCEYTYSIIAQNGIVEKIIISDNYNDYFKIDTNDNFIKIPFANLKNSYYMNFDKLISNYKGETNGR